MHPRGRVTRIAVLLSFFFFNDTATTEIYTLSLHDALPILDRLKDWWESNKVRFPEVTKLVLNLDNGPENHSRRTQFLKRMVGFAHEYRLDIELAYYPPYHSKYNPGERCWGILELHCNGALLDSVEAVLGDAETMTWKGGHPEVVLVETQYSTGVRLGREEMEALESMITRLPTLE